MSQVLQILHRALREPLVHFLAIGLSLFALYSLFDRESGTSPEEVLIDEVRIDALRSEYERQWRRPPTEPELIALVEGWLRDEILYREGIALGLDRNDPVIRRRVAQKVSFMVDQVMAAPVTEEALKDWFEANAEDYRLEASYSFQQVFLDPARHPGSFDEVIGEALAALNAGADPAGVGDGALLQSSMSAAPLSVIARDFGDSFATQLTRLATGKWSGPVLSTFGTHLVRIDSSTPARDATLDEVRARVTRDIESAARQNAGDMVYDELRKRYRVRFAAGLPTELTNRLAVERQ